MVLSTMGATRDTGAPGAHRAPGATRATGGPGTRFEHVPALDGIRAAALLAVMAYHGGLASAVPGGLFSLDAFFCLSGFLITSLLVAEWRRTGTIALRAFWARRARRLLPALLLLLVGIAVWAHWFAGPGRGPTLRLDELSTLFYVANWHFVAVGSNYFVQTGPPSPLLHTWSLAVEEQFYLVWPVLAVVVLRRSRTLWPLLVTAVVGAAASVVEMALLYQPADPTRVYFGSDTHAQSLLIGAAVAVGLALWRQRGVPAADPAADPAAADPAAAGGARDVGDGGRRAPAGARPLATLPTSVTAAPARLGTGGRLALVATAVAGTTVTAYLWARVGFTNPFSFEGGVAVASLAVGGVIVATMLVPGNPVARVLAWAPLRALGRISYGVYLWHYPFDLWLTHANTGTTGPTLLAIRTAATLAVSIASYQLVEQPVRQGQFFRAARAWALGPTTVAATVVAVIAGTTVPAVAVSAVRSELPAWPPTPTGPPVRVLLVGDSVALTLGIDLAEQQAHADVQIRDDGLLGCGVALGTEIRVHGQVYPVAKAGPDGTGGPGTCRPGGGELWPQYWSQQIAAFHPDVVVLVAGRWETVDRTSPSGRWTNILDPSYAAYVEKSLELAAVVATSKGAHMIMETSPCFDTGEQPNGQPWPEDNPARVAAYNRLVRAVAAKYPATVTVQDLGAMACPGGRYTAVEDGIPIRESDGIHFTYAQQPNAGTVLGPELLPLWYRLGHAVQLQRAGH